MYLSLNERIALHQEPCSPSHPEAAQYNQSDLQAAAGLAEGHLSSGNDDGAGPTSLFSPSKCRPGNRTSNPPVTKLLP